MKPKKAGRPPLEGGTKSTHTVHLTRHHVATAKRLSKAATGKANISLGVRIALDALLPKTTE